MLVKGAARYELLPGPPQINGPLARPQISLFVFMASLSASDRDVCVGGGGVFVDSIGTKTLKDVGY